jgi:hypothetical protein
VTTPAILGRFPEMLGGAGPTWVRVPDLYALHAPVPRSLTADVVWTLEAEGIAVLRGQPRSASIPVAAVTPVYARPSGPPAVPTGRVFVRFAENVRADLRRRQLSRAGWELVEAPAWAPHTAWVRPASGDIAAALAGLDALAALPDVARVEPEMLAPAVRR